MRRTPIMLMALALGTAIAGCAARTPDWPLRTTKIGTGPGTVEAVHRQLKGTWTLQNFAILQNQVPRSVPAWAELTYDGFGSVTIQGIILDPARRAASGGPDSLLNYSGRVVIDAGRGEIWLEGAGAISPSSGATREPMSGSHVRRLVLEVDSLVLTFMAAEGGPAVASAVFTRAVPVR